MKGLFVTKTIAQPGDVGGPALRRVLGALDLTLLGVGAVVGAGIFTTIGTAAAGNAMRPGAGPSLILSFLITAVVCAFTALCYAELASTVPVSGSAYTYAYATLGELTAWVIGWDLILEYAISNVAIAISWAHYARTLLGQLGINVPWYLATDLRSAALEPGLVATAPHLAGVPVVFNLLAAAITMALTVVVIWGIRESARLNAAMVLVKIAVLAFFVGLAAWWVPRPTLVGNWQPFFPNGATGTLTGAAIVFFAFVGYDSISTVAEETRNPGRNVPLGIIASLAVCTVLYLVVTCAFTGMVPFDHLKTLVAGEHAEPLTVAMAHVAPDAHWPRAIIAAGAVAAETTALLVYQVAQPRIFFAMARDGLLPATFARIHPRFGTPWATIVATGAFIAVVSTFTSIDEMVDLCNIGTLFAFVVVCVGVPVLRLAEPHRERPFRVPLGPVLLPGLGAASCLGLMWFLPPASWWRFLGWLVAGVALYLAYGYSHSQLGRQNGRSAQASARLKVGSVAVALIALGLFVLPHTASALQILGQLLRRAGSSRVDGGVALIAVGLVLALACLGWRPAAQAPPRRGI